MLANFKVKNLPSEISFCFTIFVFLDKSKNLDKRSVRPSASIRQWDCSSAGKAVRCISDAISGTEKGSRQLAISGKQKSEQSRVEEKDRADARAG